MSARMDERYFAVLERLAEKPDSWWARLGLTGGLESYQELLEAAVASGHAERHETGGMPAWRITDEGRRVLAERQRGGAG